MAEEEAPAAAEVDFVALRGLGPLPLELARVQRAGRVLCVRSQLVAAGFASEKSIREAAGSVEHCCEAWPVELAALKGLVQGGVPARTARSTLVDVRWLADALGEASGLHLVQARMLFAGLVPLPANLPAEEEKEEDDLDFDEATEPEGNTPQPLRRAAREKIIKIEEIFFGCRRGPAVRPRSLGPGGGGPGHAPRGVPGVPGAARQP